MGEPNILDMGNEPSAPAAEPPAQAPPAAASGNSSRANQESALIDDIARVNAEFDVHIDDYKTHLKLMNPRDVYKFESVLGSGHFGKVYQVKNLSTGEVLACKEID